MPTDDHLRVEQYVETREGRQSRATLSLRLHDHLVQVCADCGSAWQHLGAEQDRLRDLLRDAATTPAAPPPSHDEPSHHLPGFLEEAQQERRELSELRSFRRKIRKEARELERQSPEERIATVEKARRRFRSPALAECLIEIVRERVRNDPRDAEDLAALVPRVLHWARDDTDPAWIQELHHRAAAWRANALRVAGDLPAADRAFLTLRRAMSTHPVDDPGLIAETASLEASLRIDQRRLGEAAELLARACLLYRGVGDEEGVGRVLLKKAILLEEMGRPAEALAPRRSALQSLDKVEPDAYILFCAVHGALDLLCELGRYDEAADLLESRPDPWKTEDDPYMSALLRGLRGRIAVGQGRHEDAAADFQAAMEGLLALGRRYDAALAALHMAHCYLEANQVDKLKPLARDLVPLFQSRGVAREALGALQLLSRAIAEEQLNGDTIVRLRDFISKGERTRTIRLGT